ncbi:MAG: phosphohydrolase, partial [Acidovorax sp.]
MNLVTINVGSIQLGHPLPFALRGADGTLLAQKGFVVQSRDELGTMLSRGRQLCVDVEESGESYRAYVAQLQRMLRQDTNLGELASVKMTAGAQAAARERDAPSYVVDWPALQERATQLLRSPHAFDFPDRFQPLHAELARNCEQSPDATLTQPLGDFL